MDSDQQHEQRPASPQRPALAPDDCVDAIETLYSFLDGELTPERRTQIQVHLDRCSPCLRVFDFEAEIKLMVARHCRDTVPDSLRKRVADALADVSRERGEVP